MPSFTLDPWKDKSQEELKASCRHLSRAVSKWQHIAMCLATNETVKTLPVEWQEEVMRVIASYED